MRASSYAKVLGYAETGSLAKPRQTRVFVVPFALPSLDAGRLVLCCSSIVAAERLKTQLILL